MQQLNMEMSVHLTWKRSLLVQLDRYRTWLEHNHLQSPELEHLLDHAQQTLSGNNLTLAFVGEFSRGKTELINALFFSTHGDRLLPSRAGRTTMCPTEIFYDPDLPTGLRLLPVETRLQSKTVADFRQLSGEWVDIDTNFDDPLALEQALSSVAQTREVSRERALELGFNPEHLDTISNSSDRFFIPAWRHALLNVSHPLLKQGLRILDTPGLNALGAEPELTLSMLPAADAIIYLLGADTGVTASDMNIWNEHICQLNNRRPSNLFAVLNKVDSLYDELTTDEQVRDMVANIRQATARHLNVPTHDVLPLSARQALLGRIHHRQDTIDNSGILALERLLSKELIYRQETLINERIVDKLVTLLNNSRSILRTRHNDLISQQCRLNNSRKDNHYLICDLTSRTKELHNLHHRRLLALKSSRRLVLKQGDALMRACRPALFNARIESVQAQIRGSLTTIGIGQAIKTFFTMVHDDIYQLGTEAKLANRLINSIYQRYRNAASDDPLRPPSFNARIYLNRLDDIRQRADFFRSRLSTVFADQNTVARRFLHTLAQEVIALHKEMANEAAHWTDNALLPMMQHALEQKQFAGATAGSASHSDPEQQQQGAPAG